MAFDDIAKNLGMTPEELAKQIKDAKDAAAVTIKQPWGQPLVKNPTKTISKPDPDAKTHPYKCAACGKRFITSNDRNHCLELHKADAKPNRTEA
jgi:hypothetical protein